MVAMKEKVLWLMTQTGSMKLDVMIGDMWKCTVTVAVTPFVRYKVEELKSFIRMQRPSLTNVDFDIYPCGRPQFRN